MIRLILLIVLISTLLVQTAAYCRFVLSGSAGYTCELENVNASSFTDIVDLSGVHVGGRTNAHVDSVEVYQTSILTEIPMNIFVTFFNLEYFGGGSNSIRRIELPHCGSRMKTLQLSQNSLSDLQNGAFRGCRSIEVLYSVSNSIQRIEENVFDDLPQLRQLILVNTTLVEVRSRWFRNQHLLQNLRLDQSTISYIQPGSFQCKEFLSNLDLRQNRLLIIETGTFTNLPRLRTLYLQTNFIRTIEEGAFANLPLLESVELVENLILVLDSMQFGTLPNLGYLGVAANDIRAIDRHIFRRFPVLRTFIGSGNVCFSEYFLDIENIENDVFPYLQTCFSNFNDVYIN